jgi:hypothetical protein
MVPAIGGREISWVWKGCDYEGIQARCCPNRSPKAPLLAQWPGVAAVGLAKVDDEKTKRPSKLLDAILLAPYGVMCIPGSPECSWLEYIRGGAR